MSASHTNVAAGCEGTRSRPSTNRNRVWRSILASFVASAPLTSFAQPTPDPVLTPVPTLTPSPIQAIPGPSSSPDNTYYAPPATVYPTPAPGMVYPTPVQMPVRNGSNSNQSVPIRPFAPGS